LPWFEPHLPEIRTSRANTLVRRACAQRLHLDAGRGAGVSGGGCVRTTIERGGGADRLYGHRIPVESYGTGVAGQFDAVHRPCGFRLDQQHGAHGGAEFLGGDVRPRRGNAVGSGGEVAHAGSVFAATAHLHIRKRRMSTMLWMTRSGARGSATQAARRLAMLRRVSISRSASTPPSEDSLPPSKRAMMGLPQTGDRPGSAGVDSTLAGMASEIDRVEVSQPNPIADQSVVPCPLNLVNNPGPLF